MRIFQYRNNKSTLFNFPSGSSSYLDDKDYVGIKKDRGADIGYITGMGCFSEIAKDTPEYKEAEVAIATETSDNSDNFSTSDEVNSSNEEITKLKSTLTEKEEAIKDLQNQHDKMKGRFVNVVKKVLPDEDNLEDQVEDSYYVNKFAEKYTAIKQDTNAAIKAEKDAAKVAVAESDGKNTLVKKLSSVISKSIKQDKGVPDLDNLRSLGLTDDDITASGLYEKAAAITDAAEKPQ